MIGPYLAGLPIKGFGGKSSVISTPVPMKNSEQKAVKKVKMKSRNKPLHTK